MVKNYSDSKLIDVTPSQEKGTLKIEEKKVLKKVLIEGKQNESVLTKLIIIA